MREFLEFLGTIAFMCTIFFLGYLMVVGSILWLNSNLNDNKVYIYNFNSDNNLTKHIETWNNNTTENKFINWRSGIFSAEGADGFTSVAIAATTPEEFIDLQQQMDSEGPVFFESTWIRSFYKDSSVTNKWSFLAWNRNGYISYTDRVSTDVCYPLYTIKDNNGVVKSIITIGKACEGEKFSEDTIKWNKSNFWPFNNETTEEEIKKQVKEFIASKS